MKDHHHHHSPQHTADSKDTTLSLAVSATLHCLLGCGIGEVIGMIIGTALGWSNMATMILAVVLGFVMGYLLGILPLIRSSVPVKKALSIVAASETLSILVMETAEVLIQVYTPGVMEAGLTDSIFWLGMLAALVAGFVAAFPVNVLLIRRGVRHSH